MVAGRILPRGEWYAEGDYKLNDDGTFLRCTQIGGNPYAQHSSTWREAKGLRAWWARRQGNYWIRDPRSQVILIGDLAPGESVEIPIEVAE